MIFLEAIAYTAIGIGLMFLGAGLIVGAHWLYGLLVFDERYPGTHISGPDDEEVDFHAALRSIGGPR